MKIAVGLSGGVDSSVCAYLLQQQGHDVTAITMKLTSEDDHSDAKKTAEFLKIPFYEIDLTKEYREKIIAYVKEDYENGRTPNPCVRCKSNSEFSGRRRKNSELSSTASLPVTTPSSTMTKKHSATA